MTVQTIAGILNIADSQRTYVEGVGQRTVYDAIGVWTQMVNEDLLRVSGMFISKTTEDHKFRYYLPADGELQDKSLSGLGRVGERKVTGSWDVALPLKSFGDAIGSDRKSLAYMTVEDLQRSLDGVALRAKNTLRKQILKNLLDNTDLSFVDELRGTLTIKPLANGDGTLYPPVAGGTTAAQATYYAESGYAVGSISDTNNPIKTVSDALALRWGYENERVRVVLIDPTAQAKVEALTDFVEVDDPYVKEGVTTAQVLGLPSNVPGKIIGRASDAFVSVWPWMPANYMIGIDLAAEAPLYMRVHPSYTNLPQGLTMVVQDENYPLNKSEWEWDFGLGVVNRLNGYVMELGTGGSYTVPTGYSK